MKSLLVVSADPRQNARIKAALSVQGWWVSEVADRQTALRAAADQAPNLVLVDGDLPGALDLAKSFSVAGGGPGIVLLGGGPAAVAADAVLPKPVETEEMVRAVHRLLAAPKASGSAEAPRTQRRFTADELFGDILREIESLGSGEEGVAVAPAPAARPRPAAPVARTTPAAPPPVAAATAPPVAAPPPADQPSAPASAAPLSEAAAPAAAAPASSASQPGERFGQYVLERRLARGGMAEIWLARMTGVEGFEKAVAIKKILPHLTESGDFEKMFIDEAKLAARLNHENIIHIFDLGRIGDEYYIAMEYVEGKDLRSMLNQARRRGMRIPRSLAVKVGARLASALHYAHNHPSADGRPSGIIHRDVSPRNVLLGYDGRVKLCDFGIAKAASTVGHTQIGAIKGKLQYMSPEQAWGRPVDARSDIFSLGVVLYELVSGERLFTGDNEIGLLEEVRECRVKEPRRVDPSIPDQLNRIVVRALKKDPEDRYPSAAEMQKELEALLYLMPPTDDLSHFLSDLFADADVAGEVLATRPIPVLVPPSLAAPEDSDASSGVFEEYGKGVDEFDDSEERRQRWVQWALAAALLAAVAVVVWMLAASPPEQSAAAQPAEAAAAPAEEALAPAEEGSAPAATAAPGESPVVVLPPALLGAAAPSPASDAEDDGEAIEDLVSRELARREADLRRRQLDQEAGLRRELERLQQEESKPPDGASEASSDQPPSDDGGGGPPAVH
jgi:serine/threonine protein kinase